MEKFDMRSNGQAQEIAKAAYDHHVTKNSLTPAADPQYLTGLAQWLTTHNVTRHELATKLNVSPHTIDKIASGAASSIKMELLRALSERTQLTYEQILNPVQKYVSPYDTGDSRFNRCLSKLCQLLHTDAMYDECKMYISPDFICSGALYKKLEMDAVDFKTMCKLNVSSHTFVQGGVPKNQKNKKLDTHVSDIILSVTWYTPGNIDPLDSRHLHTYWRSLAIGPGSDVAYNDTFVVLEFKKSVNDMTPIEQPQITNWWWDQPSQYNRAPVEAPSDKWRILSYQPEAQ